MVTYNCECCNYETTNITNYKRHNTTQKHINNDKFSKLKNEFNILKNDASKINNDVNNLKNNASKINNVVKTLKDDTNKIKTETMLEINKAVRKQNKFNRSVMTILSQEFAQNPPLEKISEKDFIKELELEYSAKLNQKDCKLQLLILQDYRNKRLLDTLSKLILKFIKKEEISLQSIFNTDCSRGNYATKLETTWLNDKFGMKFRDIILRPIIEYTIDALEPLRTKIINLRELNKTNPSIDKSDFIMENSNYLLEVNCMLVKKKTYEQIIYKISPQLQLELVDDN